MEFLFLLILSIFTYLLVQRTVGRVTKTPVWLLWLVLMLPLILWTVMTSVYQTNQLPPRALGVMLWSLIICPILYWFLFQLGRRSLSDTQVASQVIASDTDVNPTPETSPPVRPISAGEETQLRNCFPWSVFYLQDIEYRPQAIICRGQLRGQPDTAYQRIQENVREQFGDRFVVMLQEDLNGKPFFALVPNTTLAKSYGDSSQKLTNIPLALGLLGVTLITTAFVGLRFANVSAEQLQQNPDNWLLGLSYAISLMVILGCHEMGHYLTAKLYRIRSTLPYFIPIPFFLGTFGAFIQMRSPFPNRKALFDVSFAGPIVGLIATLPFLIWGLSNSQIVTLGDRSPIFDFNAFNPRNSLLFALIAKSVWGNQLVAGNGLNLHPVAIAGLLGLIITALNLMPVGQLDGGHIIHAMFGQRNAIIIGQITRFLLLLLSLVQREYFIWAIILLFFPLLDEPALNDVTELDNRRDTLGLMAMALLIAIVLPLPTPLGRLLNI